MEMKKILELAHTGYKEFFDVWRRHRKNQGPGALVFTTSEIPDEGDNIPCEYWTLGELRQYVRRMNECDEVVGKWISDAAREGGYPIVIFSTADFEVTETIHFLTVTNAQVA